MMKTTYKSKDCQPMATFTWVALKKTTSTCSLQIILLVTTDLSMTFFSFGTIRKPPLMNFFQVHASIKFVCKYSYKQINFLDTTICINGGLTLTTKLFKKDNDRNVYLHHKSYLPGYMKNHIPMDKSYELKEFAQKKKICNQ